MNKLNEHPNLKNWCEKHYENTKIRVHPTNVPLSSILDEVLGRLELAETALNIYCSQGANDNQKIKELEEKVAKLEKRKRVAK